MVAIPEYIDPVIAEIDRLLEAGQQGHTTKNIGFGEIGHDCSRYLYLKIHANEPEIFDAATLRRFIAGKIDEELMSDDLRKVVELHTTDPNRKNKQFKLDLLNGRFTGRLDGAIVNIPQAPKTWHVWEHKSCEDKLFDKLLKLKQEAIEDNKILLEWNHKYYAQVQTNMLASGMDRCYFTVSTPGLRRVTSLRIKFDKDYANSLVEKARMIINASEPPPKIGGPDWYQCKNCRFYNTCHGV